MFGLPDQAEHELQLFLSHHWASYGTELYEPRWHGGFSMAFHPPAFHLVVGWLGRLLSVERSYALIVACLPVLMTTAVALLVWWWKRSLHAAAVAAWLVAAQPLLYVFVFPLGQTPFVFASMMAIFAVGLLHHGLEDDRVGALVASAAALVLTVAAHPVAGVVAAPFVLASLLHVFRGAPRAMVAWFVVVMTAGFVALVSLAPFIQTLREASSSRVQDKWVVFVDHQATLAFAVLGLLLIYGTVREPTRWGRSLLGGCCLALAAVGRVPFVPPDKWLFVTALVLVWLLLDLPVMVVAMLVTSSVIAVGAQGKLAGERRFKKPLAEAVDYLAADTQRFRYITIGIGDERLQLGRRTNAVTVDGGVASLVGKVLGTPLPAPSVDRLDVGKSEHLDWLNQYLAQDRHVRWLLTADPRLRKVAEAQGFAVRNAWGSGVVLWQRTAAVPLPLVTDHQAGVWFVWLPALSWLVLLSLSAIGIVRRVSTLRIPVQWLSEVDEP